MGPGSDARDCATKEKPVCCVEMARSFRYSSPSTFQVIGRQR